MASDANGEGGAASSETPGGQPHPIFNWMSVLGGAAAAMGATAAAFFFLVGLFTHEGGAYGGLLLLPPVLVAGGGLLFFVAGWIREARRQSRGEQSSFFDRYVVDPWEFVRTKGPITVLLALAIGTAVLLSAGAGSLAAVEFTSSNTFCGEVCHAVMEPEYVAYDHSPHSRVDCVECHVGPGAEGYLAAKIGGMRQLYGVTLGEVTRPIPTPIHGPISRAQCEKCHSSELQLGYETVTNQYFVNGYEDFPVRLAMAVKVGGGSNGLLGGSGIHYHMQIAEKVEYIAHDAKRQQIGWVRATARDGEVREFSSEAYPLTDEERESLPVHEMQCIDCHSRPAHVFGSPVELVNAALQAERIPGDIPFLKGASVRALDGDYATTEEAMEGIGAALEAYYEEDDPDLLEERSEDLERTADVLRELYQRNVFPGMKASWRAHPDNSGHLESPGCFRCHNDEMVDEEGEPLFADCAGCHAVLAQDDQAIANMAEFGEGQRFIHPEDGSVFEDFSLCSDCHTGGKEIYE